jgi:hypothetical protein
MSIEKLAESIGDWEKLLVRIKFVTTFCSMAITEYMEDDWCWRYAAEKRRAFLTFCVYIHVRDQEIILKW